MAFEDIHPRFSGFDGFFQRELKARLTTLDTERKAAWWRGLRIAVPVIVIGGALLLWLGVEFYHGRFLWSFFPHLLLMMLTLVATVGLAKLAFARLRKVRGEGKQLLLEGVCRFLGYSFEPSASGFPLAVFYDSGLLRKADRERASDRIHGALDGLSFDLCELHLQDRRRGRRSSKWVTAFHGQLAAFAAPRKFDASVLIARDAGFLGNFLTRNLSQHRRVAIDAPDFEKRYEVYSDNAEEARKLLGAELRACFLALAEGLEVTPAIGLVGDRVLIAADSRKDYFEGSGLSASLVAEREVRRLLTELSVIFRMVETLQLAPPAR